MCSQKLTKLGRFESKSHRNRAGFLLCYNEFLSLMRPFRVFRLLLTLIVLKCALMLLLAQTQGLNVWLFLIGVEQLRYPLVLAGILSISYAILQNEWKGVRNLKQVESFDLAAVEREHPYLPSTGQVIATVFLTIVCAIQTTPAMAKTYQFASSLLGLDEQTVFVSQANPAQPGSLKRQVCFGDVKQCAMAVQILELLPKDCRTYMANLTIGSVGRSDLHGFTDTYRRVTISPETDEIKMATILTHECGHIIDFFALRGSPKAKPTPFTFRTLPTTVDDPSLKFYEISWKDAKNMRDTADWNGFVSEYATLLPIEDFAETFTYYVLQPQAFKERAARNAILKRKYLFMEELLKEEEVPATQPSAWDGKIPVSVTDLGFEWKI
jgi:hypothetical protein